MKSHIDKIGIEFEGAWYTLPDTQHRLVSDIHNDGSLEILPDEYDRSIYVKETVSKPIKVKDLKEFIDYAIPDIIDESCGLHVHVSFKRGSDYLKLATSKFSRYWKRQLALMPAKLKFSHEINSRLVPRIEGENSYCSAEFDNYSTLVNQYGDRYKQINFCSYFKHGTIELRVLSAFSKKEKIECFQAITYLLNIVESFLEMDKTDYTCTYKTSITEDDLVCAF